MGRNKVKKVMKKLCVCTLSAVIGMLSIQIMPVSAASKTGMGKITNKINKAGYNLWGGYDSPEEAATYDIDFYDSGINAGVAVGGNISLKYNDSYDYGNITGRSSMEMIILRWRYQQIRRLQGLQEDP